MKIHNIFMGLLIILVLAGGISIHSIYRKYNNLLQARKSEEYKELYNTIEEMQISIQELQYGLDSLQIQNDSIKLLQYENIQATKQAKKSADRAVDLYRDTHISLPEL